MRFPLTSPGARLLLVTLALGASAAVVPAPTTAAFVLEGNEVAPVVVAVGDPSAANWILRTGTQYPGGAANWGTGEVETASASTANVYLDGTGRLNIKAIRDGAGNWTSGRIETQRTDFAANAGEMVRFSAVVQQPNVANGLGYWPAFRATGAAYRGNYNNWPGIGETDIMSGVNGRSQLSNTLHCGTAPDGPCGEYNGRTSGLASCQGCQTAFHEYAQVIDRTKTEAERRALLDAIRKEES